MKYFIVDAFTNELFRGNPAGVCFVDKPINDDTMQKIAFENNLAETAFLIKKENYYDLRWFTPEVEIDLCGHATLASAFVIMNYVEKEAVNLAFHTKSGVLNVSRDGHSYVLDFPSRKPIPCNIPDQLEKALGIKVLETHKSRDLLILLESEADVQNLNPDISLLKQINEFFGFIVTAKSNRYDFVSRFFAPNAGIMEDPVTGSSHTSLIPFWSERLHKNELVAAQLSKRGGVLQCKDLGDRVTIGGEAICYLIGEINTVISLPIQELKMTYYHN